MTKKWNTLLNLLNNFNNTSDNAVKQLITLLVKCYNENAVLVCKMIIYTRFYNINSQDVCDKAEYLIDKKEKSIFLKSENVFEYFTLIGTAENINVKSVDLDKFKLPPNAILLPSEL